MKFFKREKVKRLSMVAALRLGNKQGFERARSHPEETLEEYLAQIDDLVTQLKQLDDKTLKALANEK